MEGVRRSEQLGRMKHSLEFGKQKGALGCSACMMGLTQTRVSHIEMAIRKSTNAGHSWLPIKVHLLSISTPAEMGNLGNKCCLDFITRRSGESMLN